MGGPLSGVRVLDFTRYQQGPYATSLLADMGADVLKVEGRQDGEFGRQTERDQSGFSAYFESYNRGKRSITLDIRCPEGGRSSRSWCRRWTWSSRTSGRATWSAWGWGTSRC